jgi:oligopeptide/dipeptide ABC transporter ATP-binding protein
MSLTPLLELRDVTRIFRVGGFISGKTVKAVNSVSFLIPSERPVITSLVGESGSGKTTIARMILGLLKPTSGEILYRGRSVSDWLKKDKLRYFREVQAIFQDPYAIYNPFYRVERALKVALKKLKIASDEGEIQELIVSAMKDLGLRPEDIMGRYPHQLSGGERQRLMLVRILLIKPRLIVADEPVSMIDASLRAIFLDQLLSLKEKIGISCLYITHDLNIAGYVSDNVVVLCHGNIVEEGPVRKLMEEPLHPYTRILINSIPIPDPKRRWKEEVHLTASIRTSEQVKVERGCVFHNRCPHVMDRCKVDRPLLQEVATDRRVACFLYRS